MNLDIIKGRKASIGEIRTWRDKKFQKQPDGSWKYMSAVDNRKSDFMYSLQSDFVIDFGKKNKIVFENFYRNTPVDLEDSLFISKTIGMLSNNLPEEIVLKLSKTRVHMRDKSMYERESGGHWVGAYNEDYNEVSFNKQVFDEFGSDYYGQIQFTKVMLHEFGHKLYRGNDIEPEVLFDLWKTGERVSYQATIDYEENFCEAFAAYLMAMDTEGDVEYNRDMADFKEEFPKTYFEISKLVKGMYENKN